MQRAFNVFGLLLAAVALATACRTPPPVPDTFNKAAAIALATITETRNLAGNLMVRSRITPDQHHGITDVINVARKCVDNAVAAHQAGIVGTPVAPIPLSDPTIPTTAEKFAAACALASTSPTDPKSQLDLAQGLLLQLEQYLTALDKGAP